MAEPWQPLAGIKVVDFSMFVTSPAPSSIEVIMRKITLSLPDSLMEFADCQTRAGRYAGLGDYVEALIRADRRNNARAALECLLTEGLNERSGGDITREDWELILRSALDQLTAAAKQ